MILFPFCLEMMPVVSFWSKSQILLEMILDLPGSPQLHIYSLNKSLSEWCLVSNTTLAIGASHDEPFSSLLYGSSETFDSLLHSRKHSTIL